MDWLWAFWIRLKGALAQVTDAHLRLAESSGFRTELSKDSDVSTMMRLALADTCVSYSRDRRCVGEWIQTS